MPDQVGPTGSTRRVFLKQTAAVSAMLALSSSFPAKSAAQSTSGPASDQLPWFKRTYRWAQTNITEIDPTQYDIPWWREHWKRTAVQGVILNAGGIVAYYPSKFPLQYRPPQLGDRDLYGELARAAHDDGLTVIARMDSSRTHEPLYRAHPDWFAVDAAGQPFASAGLYTTCINSPYYEQYLPDILREIIERSHPEGFADNSWAGLTRNSICYCQNCKKRFADFSAGKDLPAQRNWDDPIYRKWIDWSYARRIEIWDFNNKVTREAGGANCLWVGMNSGGIIEESTSFRDYVPIMQRSEIVFLDHQSRPEADGIQHNAFAGKMLHGILGWDKLIPESMPMYQNGRPASFRLTAKSEPEARMWMLSGFAGGIQPWYHHVGAYGEDRRAYQTAEPIMNWHRTNEQYLLNRTPIASVGLVWSQRNTDFFGRDNAEQLIEQPLRGFTQALVRARIPYIPIHIDNIERDGANLSVLVLANIGAMSEEQIAQIRKFVQRGGSLIASGQTSLYDHYGDARADFALADLFGVKGAKPLAVRGGGRGAAATEGAGFGAVATQQTYLRLTPELRGASYGPKSGNEPAITAKRHPVLAGFDETDILEFGGSIDASLTVANGAQALLTYIPPVPSSPPETAWMHTPRTNIPGLVVSESNGSRIAYLAADLDRQFAVNNFPDHGDLLANLVRWAAGDSIPLAVKGRGLIDCELYQQPGRLILHLVNLTNANTWRAPIDELIPIGPLEISVKLPAAMRPTSLRMLVAGKNQNIERIDNMAHFTIASILDHEVIVLEG